MADLAVLQVRRAQLIDDIATATALKNSADRAAERSASNARFATDPAAKARYESLAERNRGESQIQTQRITRLTTELAEVNAQIAALQRQQGAAQQSAGETVRDGQRARAESASPTNPPPQAQVVTADDVAPQRVPVPTNAQRTPISTPVAGQASAAQDQNINPPKKTAAQTQATPAVIPAPGPVARGRTRVQSSQTTANLDPGSGLSPTVTNPAAPQTNSVPGVAAAGDDVRASINAIFGGEQARIITQDNVLDRYTSYSYSISIYLMSPEDYARLIRSKTKNLAGFNLLIQSAGIPVSATTAASAAAPEQGDVPGAGAGRATAGRNQFFQEDFYIDDVRIKSVVSGKGTAGPHNAVSLDFRIIEPNGISLLPRLYKATQAYVAAQGGTGEANYAAQNYLMVIRFYGYDPDGNQYVPIKGTVTGTNGTATTTPTAIDKFIPFQFTNIKFRIADRLTEYTCEAVCPQNVIATGPARGVIPYNVEITSKTLQELFNGPAAFSSSSRAGTPAQTDPGEVPGVTVFPTAQPSSTATGVGSLFDLEQGVAGDPTPTTLGPSATTSLAPPKASSAATPTITQGLVEALNKYQQDLVRQGVYTIPDTYRVEILTPALQNARVVPPGQVNQRTVPMGPGSKAPANQQKNPATQSQNKDAKNTSALAGMSIIQFIDQYTRTSTYIYDQQIKIRDPRTQRFVPNGTPAEAMAWYRVGLQAVPKTTLGQDPKRNDYAYDITYQLSPYKVNDVQSDYFPQGEFQGTHKKYNYWFTGQNTQILKFEQDFNYLYYLTVNSDQPTVDTGLTTDYRERLKKAFSPRSAQSSMGTEGPVNEPSANAADYLYSPADQARIRLEILGDPAWIQQGELWAGVAGIGQLFGPFLADGTINYEGQEALFEVAFNQPVDYNLDTGIMDPTTKNFNKTDSAAGDARQSYIYRAVDVTSTFSQGRFTQELNGVLVLFELPGTQQSSTVALPIPAPEVRRGSTNTARIQSPGGTPITGGALVGDPGVSFEGSEFGAYFGSGETGGAVNYEPTGLATVRDPVVPITADSFGAEGFGDPTAVSTPPEPTPPTSSGQPVGPAASGSVAVAQQGGASGRNVGQIISIQVFTTTGVVTVTSLPEIQQLFSEGRITAQERNQASQALSIRQRAANAPVTSQPRQPIAREY